MAATLGVSRWDAPLTGVEGRGHIRRRPGRAARCAGPSINAAPMAGTERCFFEKSAGASLDRTAIGIAEAWRRSGVPFLNGYFRRDPSGGIVLVIDAKPPRSRSTRQSVRRAYQALLAAADCPPPCASGMKKAGLARSRIPPGPLGELVEVQVQGDRKVQRRGGPHAICPSNAAAGHRCCIGRGW